jgi:hypothetical protein
MPDGKKITYGDVMDLERELLDAPELPKEEQDIKDKKEVLSVLRKGILAYLRKGYSTQAVVETINDKFPEFEIADTDVRKILPKVTRKKRAAAKPPTSTDSGNGDRTKAGESNSDDECKMDSAT